MSILAVLRDCLGKEGAYGCTHVKAESIMLFQGWVDEERCKANFETIVNHVKKLPKPFLDAEGGWSFLNLPFLDNGHGGPGQQWGNQIDAGCLIVICSYFGIVQDPLKTLGFSVESVVDNLPGGVSYYSFNVEDGFLGMVRKNLGLS